MIGVIKVVRTYRKGYVAELALTHELAKLGFMTIRTPRSGRIGLASPDIIAAKHEKLIVIECKSRKNAFTVQKEQLDELQEWVHKAGAHAYIAWRLPRKGWIFLDLNVVVKNNGNIGKKFAEEHGKGIDNL